MSLFNFYVKEDKLQVFYLLYLLTFAVFLTNNIKEGLNILLIKVLKLMFDLYS